MPVVRSDLLRALCFKRGWRTYLFGALVGLGLAIDAGVQEHSLAPFLALTAASLGAAGLSFVLWRRSR